MSIRYGKSLIGRRVWCNDDYDPLDDSVCAVINKSRHNFRDDPSCLMAIYTYTETTYVHGIEILSKYDK
jgi:hypothetical protein